MTVGLYVRACAWGGTVYDPPFLPETETSEAMNRKDGWIWAEAVAIGALMLIGMALAVKGWLGW